MDEELMRGIAATTGGRYYHITDPKGLERALRDIDSLETTVTEQDVFHRYTELFTLFLVPGALLLVLAATVNTTVSRQVV